MSQAADQTSGSTDAASAAGAPAAPAVPSVAAAMDGHPQPGGVTTAALAACTSTVVRKTGATSAPPRVSTPKYGATAQVQRGDTLYGIAFRNGIDVRDLAAWNGISAPYTIYPGQSLRLYPRNGSAAANRPAANPARPPASAPAARPATGNATATRPAPTKPTTAAPPAPAAAPPAAPASHTADRSARCRNGRNSSSPDSAGSG